MALGPPPRKAAFSDRRGRSPGLRIILFAAPSQQSQWRMRLSSPLTVAGQQGDFTPFPLRPLARDPTGVTNGLIGSWKRIVKRRSRNDWPQVREHSRR